MATHDEQVSTQSGLSGRRFLDEEAALLALSAHMDSLKRKIFVFAGVVVVVVTTFRGAAGPTDTILILGIPTKGFAVFVALTGAVYTLLLAIIMTLGRLRLILEAISKERFPSAATRIGMHSSLLNPLPWFFARPLSPGRQGYMGILALYGTMLGALYAILMVGRSMAVPAWVLLVISAIYFGLGLAVRTTGKRLALALARRADEIEPGMDELMRKDIGRKHWTSIGAAIAFLAIVVWALL